MGQRDAGDLEQVDLHQGNFEQADLHQGDLEQVDLHQGLNWTMNLVAIIYSSDFDVVVNLLRFLGE